ncbi:MAG: DUF4268 domain-containing protein [Ferruginibacter sp.]|nr:DUF4268 domain-containing protein [Ferruginibacter sp.]
MYTKEEASAIRHKFWTSFGQYMSPVPSASCEKVHWINYKTGIMGISFKMNADKNSAVVAIEIMLPNTMLQYQYFSTFTKFEKQFKEITAGKWVMEKNYINEYHQSLCRIFIEIQEVNIFNKNDWPTIISF